MRASDFFSQGLRQHVLVAREICGQPFESDVLLFHLAKSVEFAEAQVGVLLSPRVGRLLGDAILPAEITDWGPTLGLPDGRTICSSKNLDRIMGPLL